MTIDLGWYVPEIKDGARRKSKPRWVLGASETHVLYSKGDRLHYECREATFRRWVQRYNARLGVRNEDRDFGQLSGAAQ